MGSPSVSPAVPGDEALLGPGGHWTGRDRVLIPGGKGRRSWRGSLPREGPLAVLRALSDALASHLMSSGNKGLLRGGQPVQLREVEKGNREAGFPLLFSSRPDPHLSLDLGTTFFQLCFLRDETNSLSQLPLGGMKITGKGSDWPNTGDSDTFWTNHSSWGDEVPSQGTHEAVWPGEQM